MDEKSEYSVEFLEEKELEETLINKSYEQYVCDSCGEDLEIEDIDYNNSIITLKCRNNEITKFDLNRFTQNEFNHIYYKSIFQQENKYNSQTNDFLEKWISSFKNFFDINKILPLKKDIKISKSNCPIHSIKFSRFCKECNNYYCDKDKNICKHLIEKIPNPNSEDIKILKDKIVFLIEQINNNIILIKFLDMLIKTYKENSSNYYNCINIIKVSKIIDKEYNKKFDNSIQIREKLSNLKEKILEKFNVKFKVNITGDEMKINLSGMQICDIDLKNLCSVTFSNLKDLNLSHNNISDIGPLNDMNTTNLNKINLAFNKIENINSFEQIIDKNKNLEEILLNNNLISDVEVLKKNITHIFEIYKP